MKKKLLRQRASAVQRYLAGEDPEGICSSLGPLLRRPYFIQLHGRATSSLPCLTSASLAKNKGNMEAAAIELGIDLATLYRKMKRLRIETH